MGCLNSKNVGRNCNVSIYDRSMIIHGASESLKGQKVRKYIRRNGFKPLDEIKEGLDDEKTSDHIRKAFVKSSNNNKHWRYVGRSSEGEGGADAWPAWLRAAAGDAINGWLPLKSDNFERLEKIGQGTYSNVYRARDLQTGRIVALKKVQFDNFKPESVSFMAREIKILRRLDHPNVMKLEGIITSKLSCDIYLVFEYMEHDLCGLLSCPHVKFTASQIKCYMLQLLKGIQHCHSRGVLHRDIKSSNILINNKGVLKIADFGLANFFDDRNKQPLTNRVVTLWYRPPELLLGSTSYGPCVDMWSVGCVFAELFNGRPILKGRTELEQLHKIFKLCGSPTDEYWKNSGLPLAALFRSQSCYENNIRERCKELPTTVVDLIYTLLSVEPEKRPTARSALHDAYFYAKPYACDPASLPTYPPNKEINAKFREAAQRKTDGGKSRPSGCSRKPRKALSCKVIPEDRNLYMFRSRGSLNSKAVSEVSQRGDSIGTVPAQAVASYGRFMWETRRQEHLQRYQSLMQPDFLNSTQVYKPRDDQEPEISRHMIMLHQLRSADVMQLEDYIRAGAHQSHSSRGAVAHDKRVRSEG
ncbi:hypothetical protein M8C21_014490 [Ambrosia artemisiifolia]|uniref:Protein kinase domain-containing protein n=1 Tax=Ambrosia artemisiifolia TaxID=4212 RepID=A0AAD5DD28_AMBAR|nr:hypothetical protein M8C21_014490 [Ambrosia artemisiifolia]